MTTAIASQLKSIIDNNTELVELKDADVYWQEKINQAVTETTNPIYLVFPQTVDCLATIVKQAFQEKWRILICGNGSKLNWGNLSSDINLVVSTQKCDRLIEHAVGDLTITVEAGMKLKDLQDKLRSHNQFLPIDPAYPETATLGGIVATADAGSWRQRYGGVRDLLLGLSFVRADGAIAKAGGRVVKNVAGYDLMKLFTGAYGTLGVISQVTFRTYPLIITSETLLLTGTAKQIEQASQTIRNSGLTPTAFDLLSPPLVKQLGWKQDLGLMIRWQTITESIQQQIAQVQAITQQLNLTTTNYQDQAESELWQKAATLTNLPQPDTGVTCKIGIPPQATVNLLQLNQIIEQDIAVRVHASKGIGKLHLRNANLQCISAIRSYCQQNQGYLTILDAPKSIKQKIDIWGYTGNATKTMKVIMNQFDPENILNPGRFLV